MLKKNKKSAVSLVASVFFAYFTPVNSNTPAYAAPSSFPRVAPSSLPGRLSLSGIVSLFVIVFCVLRCRVGCRSMYDEVLV